MPTPYVNRCWFGSPQLPQGTYVAVVPMLLALLGHNSPVVHTYAANAIERMLTVKDRTASGPATLRFGPAQLAPVLQSALTGLFGALKHPTSSENHYVMKGIMRVTAVAAEGMAPCAYHVCHVDHRLAVNSRSSRQVRLGLRGSTEIGAGASL